MRDLLVSLSGTRSTPSLLNHWKILLASTLIRISGIPKADDSRISF